MCLVTPYASFKDRMIDVRVRKEEILERKHRNEFGYTGLDEQTESSQSATGLDWSGLVGYQHKTALAFGCVGKVTTAFSGNSTKSKLVALGNATHAVPDHQHRTLQQLLLFLK